MKAGWLAATFPESQINLLCLLELILSWLSLQVDPSRVIPIDCSQEGPADWAPYEDFERQLVYLPNGTAVPSAQHKHAYGDWQYVLRLKAG
jgi:hypothetical protein